ncbi:uncharacterized protein LOC106645181 [Copidosoma floridanum]|uniref:uncharacterized protein LOC106645181 n=1 Tax=Copidosoma floridanum TaxID=29053 RepID=UPI0006C97E13|nr:uncharacterized protein LOC106645181 [Copidosoma floridanum]
MLVAPLRLPPFWKANPSVWFIRIEAAFNNHRIRADSSKFNYVVAALDDATVQEISDVLMAPPVDGKYDFLKARILKRMTDTADQSLRKLLTQLELGDQKPSQLLRCMKALTGSAVSDEAIRVRWFDLLPPSVTRSLRVVKSTPLDELASLADELIQDYPHVATVYLQATKPQMAGQSSTPTVESLAKEMASQRQSVAQLLNIAKRQTEGQQRGRSAARSQGGPRNRSATPNRDINDPWCWYHCTLGNNARNCRPPCNFTPSTQGNE